MKKILFAAALTILFINGAYAQVSMATRQMVATNCESDIKQFCANVKPGGGRIVMCLNDHKADISDSCKSALMKVKQEQ